MSKRTNKTITLGSGKLYIKEFSGEIPANTEIEKEENLIGYIQGGAELEYKPEFYTAEDDLGKAKKTIITIPTISCLKSTFPIIQNKIYKFVFNKYTKKEPQKLRLFLIIQKFLGIVSCIFLK